MQTAFHDGGTQIMNDEKRNELTQNMAEHLPVLRKTLNLTQGQLAELVGVSRSTIAYIENKKRMGWNTFLSLLMIFTKNKATDELLTFYSIYTDELNGYIKLRKET